MRENTNEMEQLQKKSQIHPLQGMNKLTNSLNREVK